MAVLSEAQIDAVWGRVMVQLGIDGTASDFTKDLLRDSIVNLDAFIDGNELAINNQFVGAVKTNGSKAQKSLCLREVLSERYEADKAGG